MDRKWIYYYPNRPLLLPPDSPTIGQFDGNWHAEIKKNGTRLCLFKDNGNWLFMNRHKELLSYVPTDEVMNELNSLDISDFTYLDAELLHFKTKHIKHQIYFFDVYSYNGHRMLSETLRERRLILKKLIKGSFKHLEVAKAYKGDFYKLFNDVIAVEENEGLVFKNANGIIEWKTIKSPDVWWQIKIRKPNKCYQF